MPSKGEKRREQRRRQQKLKRSRCREWWEKTKGSLACGSCGLDDWRCLDFHHRDPSTKLFNVGSISTRYSKKAILDEMEKCDVLCANCHRIHHWEERNKRMKS
jgi:hypothetical protein